MLNTERSTSGSARSQHAPPPDAESAARAPSPRLVHQTVYFPHVDTLTRCRETAARFCLSTALHLAQPPGIVLTVVAFAGVGAALGSMGVGAMAGFSAAIVNRATGWISKPLAEIGAALLKRPASEAIDLMLGDR